jgi:hypothetical protein
VITLLLSFNIDPSMSRMISRPKAYYGVLVADNGNNLIMVLIEAIIITVTEAVQTAAQTRVRTFGATPTTHGMVPKIKIQVAALSEL